MLCANSFCGDKPAGAWFHLGSIYCCSISIVSVTSSIQLLDLACLPLFMLIAQRGPFRASYFPICVILGFMHRVLSLVCTALIGMVQILFFLSSHHILHIHRHWIGRKNCHWFGRNNDLVRILYNKLETYRHIGTH